LDPGERTAWRHGGKGGRKNRESKGGPIKHRRKKAKRKLEEHIKDMGAGGSKKTYQVLTRFTDPPALHTGGRNFHRWEGVRSEEYLCDRAELPMHGEWRCAYRLTLASPVSRIEPQKGRVGGVGGRTAGAGPSRV